MRPVIRTIAIQSYGDGSIPDTIPKAVAVDSISPQTRKTAPSLTAFSL